MIFARCAVAALLMVASSIAIAGTATLSWTAPTLNEDGTPYTDPSHYTIRAGCIQSGQYEEQTVGPIPYTQTSVVITALPEQTDCYFVATATNQSGVESAYSNEAIKFIESTATLAGPVENLVVTWQESALMSETISHVNSYANPETTSTTTPGSGTITAPSEGDLVVVYVTSNATGSISHGGGEGSAFTRLFDLTPTSETARHALFWKIAGASEPTSYTFASGNATAQVITRIFSSAGTFELDANTDGTHRTSTNEAKLIIDAIDGEVIADNAVSIIFGAKDGRVAGNSYDTATPTDYIGEIGDTDGQMAGSAYKIYTTGTTFSGNVDLEDGGGPDGNNDVTYSAHISFIAAAPADTETTYIEVPWTTQPPSEVTEFDRNNVFGAKALWAIVPGWYNVDGAAGNIYSVGQRREFTQTSATGGAGTTATSKTQVTTINVGPSPVRALEQRPEGASEGYFPKDTTDDLGFNFPNDRAFTVVGIVKLNGDGQAPGASSDVRIFAKDSSWAQADHDLMIGLTSSQTARARIRLNGTVFTILSTATVANDTVNMVALTVEPFGDYTFGRLHLLEEDGSYESVSSTSDLGGYTPRTTTDMAIGSTAGATSQLFDGDIIAIVGFDAIYDPEALREIFENPWQIFEPCRIPVYQVPASETVISCVAVPWTTQPPNGTPVDFSNPLAEGLQFVQTGTVQRDLVSGSQGVITNTDSTQVADAAGQFGPVSGFTYGDNGSGQIAYSNPADVIDSAITVASLAKIHSTSQSNVLGSLLVQVGGASDKAGLQYSHSNASFANVFWVQTGSDYYPTGVNMVADEWHLYSGSWASGENVTGYKDGIEQDSDTTAGTSLVGSTDDIYAPKHQTVVMDADIAFSAVWNRRLTAAEHAALAANPWQIFEPQLVPVFASTAAPAGETASGAVSIAAVTADGTSKIRRKANGAVTTGAIQADGTSKVVRKASGAATVAAMVAAGTASITEVHSASGTPSIAPVQASGAATVVRKSTGTTVVAPVTASGTATVVRKASGAASIGVVTADGAADVIGVVNANGDVAIAPVTSDGSAKVGRKASGTPTIGATTATGAATVVRKASGSTSLAAIVASGAATVGGVQTASGSPSIAAIVGDGAATVNRQSSGSIDIAPIQATGAATVVRKASGTVSIPAIIADGATTVGAVKTASGAASIAAITGTGTAKVRRKASGDALIAAITADGAADVREAITASGNVSMPGIVANGTATVIGVINATGDAIVPALTATGQATVVRKASGATTIPAIQADGRAVVEGVPVEATTAITGYVIETDLIGYTIETDFTAVAFNEECGMPRTKITASNFEMFVGDSRIIHVCVKDQDDAVVDLTGATASYVFAKRAGDAAIFTKTIGSGITVTDAINGELDITIDPADTNGLNGAYFHALEITDAFGAVTTVLAGTATVRLTT